MEEKLYISKEEINSLPMYEYKGEIVLIESKEDALKALDYLKNEKVLGFDTETRAAFKKGESYNIAMLQLATQTHAYLFRVCKFKMLPEIIDILANKEITKAGVAIRDDILGLKKLLMFQEAGFVELADEAKKRKIQNLGLRGLTALVLGKRLSKRAKVSNWQKNELSEAQIIYAACDAGAGLEIYHRFSNRDF